LSPQALAAFRNARPAIIQETVTRVLAREEQMIEYKQALSASQGSAQAKHMFTAGLDFVLKTLDTVMNLEEPDIIDDQLIWVKRRLPHDGVRPEQVALLLQVLTEVLRDLLPNEYADQVVPFAQRMLSRQRQLMQEGDAEK
jgi:uncharacterized protein (DUF2267 family)